MRNQFEKALEDEDRKALLFYRLMEQAIATPLTPLGAVVGGRATPTHSL